MKEMKKTALVLSALLMICAAAQCRAEDAGTESEAAQTQAAEAGNAARVSYLGPAGTYTEEAAQLRTMLTR